MDKRCEECYFHIVEDCAGQEIPAGIEWLEEEGDCYQSIEDVSESISQI